MSSFFLISSNLIICKRDHAKIIFLIIIIFIIIIIFLVSNIHIWLLTVNVVSNQKPKNALISIQKKRRLTIATLLFANDTIIIDSYVRNISGIESENEWIPKQVCLI